MNNQRIDPITSLPLEFEAFDKSQQTILQFKGKVIEGLEILFTDLMGFAVSIQSRNRLSKRTQAEIQELKILPKRTTAVSFCNVPMDGNQLRQSLALPLV
jgi:hypothetical protein